MQRIIHWKGIEYDSAENCIVTITEKGSTINSLITGKYGDDVYKVEYQIQTNINWETIFFEIKSKINDRVDHLFFKSDGKGNWKSEGTDTAQFQGCIDIDIPLTPFTNTLPINRLKLKEGASSQIKVIYIDLLENRVHAVHQKYTRLSSTEYQYENVPNDFEATILVDDAGLVIDYPRLFTKTLSKSTS